MLAASSSSSANSYSKAKIERISPNDVAYALPIRISQSCSMIEGRSTHVVTQRYADRILIIVTQVGKMGALIQVTTHKRATLPMMHGDDFLNDDIEAVELQRQRQQEAASGSENRDATTSQALFGIAPIGQETLYDFYKQQISALVQDDIGKSDESGLLETIPVIVGLSLALSSSSIEVVEEEQSDFAELADTERQRFQAILGLVRQARVW